MKKYFIIILTVITTCLIVLAEDTKFIQALQTCSPYSESGSVNTDGMNVTSHKQILGWQDGKCVYKESVKFSETSACITCKFTKPQLNELVSVMQAYELVQQYSNENVDTSSIKAVQNNPVVKAWNKYLQDTSVCTMSAQK